MNSLLGDRFLKRFAGEIRRKVKGPTTGDGEQKPDAGNEMVGGPDNSAAEKAPGTEEAGSQETWQGSRSNGSEVNDA